MRKSKALKAVIFAASTVVLITIPSIAVKAETFKSEQGVAGIAKSLDQLPADSKTTEQALTELYNTKIRSPLYNIGVSKASNYVNVRKKPSTESEVVGKLYLGCAANILEWLEGGWVKIESGDVKGYIASDFLAIGSEAEIMADQYATKYATVTGTKTLRVRAEQSTESRTLDLIPEGGTYIIVKEYEDWAEILLSTDENNRDFTGYVSKEYISIEIEFKKAISIEEENRILREQQEAEAAEAERKRLQAEAEAKEAERKRAQEAAEKAAREEKKNNEDNYTPAPSTPAQSGNLADLRREITTYAKKFVGGPYKWSGTSLTKGADCSGFVWRIYKDFGYSIPRVSYDQARSAGKKVDIGDRQPGDLIFYGDYNGNVNHVAMYIGNDQIVHAANSRQGIIISNYNYRYVLGIRRIVY